MNPSMPKLREAIAYWFRLGLISFGGPAGQIAIMHRDLVEKKKWISESHFLHALNFCMLLPGPEAQQLATYLGWRLHGWRGGVAAGVLFVLPSALILFALSWLYMAGGHLPWLAAIFYGLLPAVIAVILSAVIRIGGKTLRSGSLWLMAALSFVGIYFFNISFVVIIFGAAIIGLLGHRISPKQFPASKGHGVSHEENEDGFLTLPPLRKPTWARSLTIVLLCVPLWALPILSLGIWLGWESTPVTQGVFFSKAALVTFGGAYAVLPYVAQQAVENFQWLTHPQMMSGLALAETTPGPLIMVLQFVGFVGGWQHPGSFSPLAAASIGAFITTWVTFVPCFLLVFLGAPYVEGLREMPRIGAALAAITAAVVGVILNLGVKFSMHALWSGKGDFDFFIALLAIAAFLAMWRFKIPFTIVLGACALLGLASMGWR
jgi:chromate transporter